MHSMSTVNPDAQRDVPDLSRRERVHLATKVDLVDAARTLLIEQGLSAVTVRAVAASLGMTAPAMYRYYESRETLLEDVIDRVYDELAWVLEQARESERNGTLTARFLVTARAFRDWALTHREEFGLLFGAPIPGVNREGDTHPGSILAWQQDRGKKFMFVWMDLFQELAEMLRGSIPWPRPIPLALREQLAEFVRRLGRPVPVDLALLFLASWQELYGFICTEAFGHLAWALDDGSQLFEERLIELRERLQLPDEETTAS